MDMSPVGLDMLTQLEGKENQMYHDEVGLPTIGVGHLLTKDELMSGKIWIDGEGVQWGNGLTDEEVETLLARDTSNAARAVEAATNVPLTQPQFDALVSFAFNVGLVAFRKSTLLKLLNDGQFNTVPAQMRRWVYAKGMIVPALQKRREVEIARWEAVA
jgi:lysozyme